MFFQVGNLCSFLWPANSRLPFNRIVHWWIRGPNRLATLPLCFGTNNRSTMRTVLWNGVDVAFCIHAPLKQDLPNFYREVIAFFWDRLVMPTKSILFERFFHVGLWTCVGRYKVAQSSDSARTFFSSKSVHCGFPSPMRCGVTLSRSCWFIFSGGLTDKKIDGTGPYARFYSILALVILNLVSTSYSRCKKIGQKWPFTTRGDN